MNTSRRISLSGRKARLAACVLLLVLGTAGALVAHSGASIQAPLTAMPFSVIDGAIDAASGPERTGAGVACTATKLYAMRTATSLYLGVDVPEVMIDPDDILLLYFDMNHNGGANPDAADRAIRLMGFPAGNNQTPATSEIYPGNGAGWGAPAAFATAKSSRAGGRLVVELTVPITAAPLGFALFYASKDLQDCNGDSDFSETTSKFPSTLPVPGGGDPLAGVKVPTDWGDLGKNAPIVTFNAPTCCSSADITFAQGGVPMVQPFAKNQVVDINAQVHNTDAATQAKNVRVDITVHKTGTGGGPIFTASPTPEIPLIGTSAAATTSTVQWTPTMGMHGCIRATILPPAEGGGKSLDDYSVGVNPVAQYNIDVACVDEGMMRIEFITFNPDRDKAAEIKLGMRPRYPRGYENIVFELEQPRGPVGPLQEATVALLVRVPPNLPPTDLPRQRVHVPPTAGRGNAVPVQVAPGDRLHLTATGDVDIDAGGGAPGTGPNGGDLSNTVRGQFLLPGDAAGTVGGALIGSFDGFATSFLVGAETTLNVPQRTEGLQLAINGLVEKATDNTGRGFDVDVWHMPALPQGEPAGAAGAPAGAAAAPGAPGAPGAPAAATTTTLPFPEVDIFATTTGQIDIGGKIYNVVTNLGGLTYQILVTEGATPPGFLSRYLLWLILLIIVAIALFFLLKKKAKTA